MNFNTNKKKSILVVIVFGIIILGVVVVVAVQYLMERNNYNNGHKAYQQARDRQKALYKQLISSNPC